MEYILSLIVCVYCVIHFDIFERRNNRKLAYRWLLIWFIVLSGFQYMVGIDIVSYVKEYQTLNTNNLTWKDITEYHVRYQPGWMLLCYICRFITSDYVLIKMIQAIFLNVAIFSFFKKHSQYLFTSILLYAISDYLVLNFNVMRHSFAIGFGLYAITAIIESKWKKFALFTFLAYMFHNSALLLLIFPIFKLFKSNKYSISLVFVIFIAFVFAISKLDLTSLFQDLLMSNLMSEGIAQVGQGYMSGERLGIRDEFAIFSLTRLLYISAVSFYIVKYRDTFFGIYGLVYVLILILSGFLPILWRYRLYVDFPFFIMLSKVIIELPANLRFPKTKRKFALYLLLYLVIFINVRDLFTKGKGEKYAAIDQYYPYHSIFDPKLNREQIRYFELLEQ